MTSNNTDREKLIDELSPFCDRKGSAEYVADFILADRQRIVEPLVKLKELDTHRIKVNLWTTSREEAHEAIDETLKRAGVK